MKTNLAPALRGILWLVFSGLLLGCTHTIKPPKGNFTGYAAGSKLPLTVGVNVTDALRQAKGETHHMGDTWVMPVGEWLAANSVLLAQHCFEEVLEMHNGQLPASKRVVAVLTPTVAYINRTMGATSFGESIVTIKMQLTLAETGAQPFWTETITGESSGSTGWTNPEKVLQKALEDLLSKSRAVLANAQAIRQFAEKQSSGQR